MKSRVLAGAAMALFVASMGVPGLPAQEPEAGQPASGTMFKTLLDFDNTDGGFPAGTLVQGADGNFYGTTTSGGSSNACDGGCGTVFRITPRGVLTALHSFDVTDGEDPTAALLLGTDGNFYGTTYHGGANLDTCSFGCGTVFKMTPAGGLTTLYSFCAEAGCADGSAPGALVQGNDGNFYGTTEFDASTSCGDGCGTVFKITPGGQLTTIYSFEYPGGFSPSAFGGLVQGTDGNFYGTTIAGGSSNACSGGCGTVFRIAPKGVLTTLHSFAGGAEGSAPQGSMIQATDGNFYGTTQIGGSSRSCGYYGCGTVFKITPQGALNTLTSLNFSDGWDLFEGLVQATDGNFYGTTPLGGASTNCFGGGCGTVFRITPTGVRTTLHNFDGFDGADPGLGALGQATNGNFYGVTGMGGANLDGTVFSLSVGLGPFVETLPTSGKIGALVGILGTDLTGATSVTFNGTPATFTVGSASVIKTTVPAGATSGTVQVVTPSGTLSSNVPFRVLP